MVKVVKGAKHAQTTYSDGIDKVVRGLRCARDMCEDLWFLLKTVIQCHLENS